MALRLPGDDAAGHDARKSQSGTRKASETVDINHRHVFLCPGYRRGCAGAEMQNWHRYSRLTWLQSSESVSRSCTESMVCVFRLEPTFARHFWTKTALRSCILLHDRFMCILSKASPH